MLSLLLLGRDLRGRLRCFLVVRDRLELDLCADAFSFKLLDALLEKQESWLVG